MVFVKNWQSFYLKENRAENAFRDILETKNAFLDHKNKKFKESKNWDFSKKVSPWFWSKIGNFSIFLFSAK